MARKVISEAREHPEREEPDDLDRGARELNRERMREGVSGIGWMRSRGSRTQQPGVSRRSISDAMQAQSTSSPNTCAAEHASCASSGYV